MCIQPQGSFKTFGKVNCQANSAESICYIMELFAVLPLMLLFETGVCLNVYPVRLSDNPGDYNTFRNSCATPPDIRRDLIYQAVVETLKQNDSSSIWLPIKRVYLGGWQWLNGENYTSKPGEAQLGLDCAVMRSVVKIIDDVPCATVYPHFMCDMQGSNTDKVSGNTITDNQILILKNKTYIIMKKSVNWYEAKEICKVAGFKLATIPTEQFEELVQEIRTHFENVDSIWIGLRKKDYFFQIGSYEEEVFQQRWNPKKLCTCPEKECVVMKKTLEEFLWEPEYCNANHKFLCYIVPNATDNPPSYGTTAFPTIDEDKPKVTISDNETTYEIFKQSCSTPPDIREPDIYKMMTEAMQKGGASTVWLPVIKKYLKGWRWLNGDHYARNITYAGENLPGLDCAILRLVNGKIDQVPCGNLYEFYLCEMQGTYKDYGAHTNNVSKDLKLPMMKYTVTKKTLNWYQAKENCHLAGSKLASLPGPLLRNVSEELMSLFNQPENVWIGLRQKDYYYSFKHGGEVIMQSWDPASLCTCPEKECAILNMTNLTTFLWMPENCNATHRFPCFSPGSSPTERHQTELVTRRWWFILIMVIISILLLVFILCVVRWRLPARRRKWYDKLLRRRY